MSYSIDVNDIQYGISEWTENQFPNRTTESITKHLESEIEEIRRDPSDAMEYADAMMLIFDCASFNNIRASDILSAMCKKLEINKKRKWGEPNADGYVEHIID